MKKKTTTSKKPSLKKGISGDTLLFRRRHTVPAVVTRTADVWIECFLDYAKALVEEQSTNDTALYSPVPMAIMNRARDFADAALTTIQDRWPGVDL